MYEYTDLVMKIVMLGLQLVTFIYYVVTAKIFFFSPSQRNKADPFTKIMVGTSFIALLYRSAVMLPGDLIYLIEIAPE